MGVLSQRCGAVVPVQVALEGSRRLSKAQTHSVFHQCGWDLGAAAVQYRV